MKKFLALIGLLTSMAFVIGSLFKTMHWPGSNVLMYGGLAFFGLLFIPLWLFKTFQIAPPRGNDRSRWIAGLASSIFLATGSIFEVLHIEGAGLLLLGGGVIFALAFLPLFFLQLYSTKQFG